MDFLQPTLKIEQVMLPGLYHDINFTTTDRVDRCMTCHQAANRAGLRRRGVAGAVPHAIRGPSCSSSDGSPHPYNQFGCTVCHAGLDRATDFSRAGHTPAERGAGGGVGGEARLEAAEVPGDADLPGRLRRVGLPHLPRRQRVDAGRARSRRRPQAGHQDGLLRLPRDRLRRVHRPAQDRARPAQAWRRRPTDGWAAKWVEAPREFRPTTFMPHFFFQENIEGDAEQGVPARRDRVGGRLPVEQVGAAASYARGARRRRRQRRGAVQLGRLHRLPHHGRRRQARRLPRQPRAAARPQPRCASAPRSPPAGSTPGSRTPSSTRPDTAMPNLRLTDQEAADLTAFLMAQPQARRGRSRRASRSTPSARAELIKGYLRSSRPSSRAKRTSPR